MNAKTHGAFGDFDVFVVDGETENRRILAPLDVVQLQLDRYVGNNIQTENWEVTPATFEDPYVVLRRLAGPQGADMLISYLDRNGPLLHSYSNRIQTNDRSVSKLSHSLSIIQPEQLHWRVGPHPTYPNKLRVEADFRFDGHSYCLVVTDPIWEARCRRIGPGFHPHSKIATDTKEQVLLTISLAEVPLHGYHYKLVAAVIHLPA